MADNIVEIPQDLTLVSDEELASLHTRADAEWARLDAVEQVNPQDLQYMARLTDDLVRRRVRHVVTEIRRVEEAVELMHAGRLRDVGPLFTASHVSLRDDFEITVPELDVAVDAALAAGALGARMTGGGFGGCIIALVEADAAESTLASIEKAFAEHGFTPPSSLAATPSPGASRLS